MLPETGDGMNELDVVILVIIGVSGLMSFRVGLIREAFALGALLIGLLAAIVLGRVYGSEIPDLIGTRWATEVVFFLVCFLVFYLIVTLLGSMIAKLIKAMQLRWVDHLLGFLFGCVRGAILAVLILAALTLVLPERSTLLAHSSGYSLARGPLRVLARMLPEKAEEVLRRRHEIYRDLIPEELEEKREPPPFGNGVPL
jgi:membrane protein required for colicin V production